MSIWSFCHYITETFLKILSNQIKIRMYIKYFYLNFVSEKPNQADLVSGFCFRIQIQRIKQYQNT